MRTRTKPIRNPMPPLDPSGSTPTMRHDRDSPLTRDGTTMARSDLPSPPAEGSLGELRRPGRSRHRPLERLSIELVSTTPIFGGGVVAGQPDERVPIRVPSIRGHLRFWWRALQVPGMPADEMRDRERELFGGAAGDEGAASHVIVTVSGVGSANLDQSPIRAQDDAGYALWPARQPPKDRWKPDLKFTLTLDAPRSDSAAVRQALLAWILFGGYGGRTRRGLGSLACASEAARREWLPAAATAQAIADRLARDVFANPKALPATDTPRLAGATLLTGPTRPSAHAAWTEALEMLSNFRQGTNLAREPASTIRPPHERRPGRSRWPEADKVRQLVSRPTAHDPRYNDTPAWPRAAFGLPIVARFQQEVTKGQRYAISEPASFELVWQDANGKPRDRLASPLILKPLALRNGQFAPIALWLDRAFPDGMVVAKITDREARGRIDQSATAAPFDRILADGDKPLFEPLVGHASVRDAFLAWILTQPQWSLAAGAQPR